jgi:hypothetical protein
MSSFTFLRRHLVARDQHERHDRHEPDGREVLLGIVGQLVEAGIDGERCRDEEQGVAVAGWLCTYCVATMVFAPALFSTTTGWPSFSVSAAAASRAAASEPPPGGKPTMSLIGLAGNWAEAPPAPARQARAKKAIEAMRAGDIRVTLQ